MLGLEMLLGIPASKQAILYKQFYELLVSIELEKILSQFNDLGGVSENITQKNGEYGRGVFSLDPSKPSKIMTPKNLLVDRNNIILRHGDIVLKDGSNYSANEINFLEEYYNNFSWGNKGNCDSAAFLNFLSALPDPLIDKLLSIKFVDQNMLCNGSLEHILDRFIAERNVRFGEG